MFDAVGVVLFWAPVGLIIYHWLAFPVLLVLLSRFRKQRECAPLSVLPKVTLVVAAYNEETTIEAKVRNCLEIDYPSDKLEILVGSDASDDATDCILSSFRDYRLKWFRLPKRSGKAAVMNSLFSKATGDLVLITDADITVAPDVVRLMARRFSDPSVGIVQAHYRRVNRDGSLGESLFDRWETKVKELEGKLGVMVTPNGMGMIIRRSLCEPMPVDTVHDDLLLGIRALQSGYRVVYERRALATCKIEAEGIEFRRRIKIGRGNMQVLARQLDMLSPKYGFKALIFFSHKTVRALVPFCLLLMLVGCAPKFSSLFFAIVLAIQLVAYASTPLVLLVKSKWRRLFLPQYYLLMNIGLLVGNLQYIFGPHRPYWERTPRA